MTEGAIQTKQRKELSPQILRSPNSSQLSASLQPERIRGRHRIGASMTRLPGAPRPFTHARLSSLASSPCTPQCSPRLHHPRLDPVFPQSVVPVPRPPPPPTAGLLLPSTPPPAKGPRYLPEASPPAAARRGRGGSGPRRRWLLGVRRALSGGSCVPAARATAELG